jgi:hypothetical protein
MQETKRMSFFWVIAAISVLTAAKANAEMIKGYPDAIICHPGNSRVIAYLDDVKDDGSALYKPRWRRPTRRSRQITSCIITGPKTATASLSISSKRMARHGNSEAAADVRPAGY